MVDSRVLNWSPRGLTSGRSVARTYPFFDLSCCSDYSLTVVRNRILRKSGQKPGEADGAYEFLVRPEDRSGDSGNIRIPLAQTDIDPLLSNFAGRCAFTPAESSQDLSGRAETERDHVALLDVVPRQSIRVDTVKAHANVATRYVERRAFSSFFHKVEKNGSYYDAEIQALSEYRTKTPQHGPEMIETVSVPRKIPEAFQRDRKSQYRGFCKPASYCQVLEWKGRWTVMKDIQQGEGTLDRFDPGKTVIRASRGRGGAAVALPLRHDSPPRRSSRMWAGSTAARRPVQPGTRDTHTVNHPNKASDQNPDGGPNSFFSGGAIIVPAL